MQIKLTSNSQIGKESNAVKVLTGITRSRGYKDQNDPNSFTRGGIRINPNSNHDNEDIPFEVGSPKQNPRKYTVAGGGHYGAPKRSKGPPSSDDSDTIRSKPSRKSRKPDDKKSNRRSLLSRQGAGTLNQEENTASNQAPNSQANQQGQLPADSQNYIDAWILVRSNAEDILWPFLQDMLDGTNSSLVIGAAWSVYAHMIPGPYSVAGPFYYGTFLPCSPPNHLYRPLEAFYGYSPGAQLAFVHLMMLSATIY